MPYMYCVHALLGENAKDAGLTLTEQGTYKDKYMHGACTAW